MAGAGAAPDVLAVGMPPRGMAEVDPMRPGCRPNGAMSRRGDGGRRCCVGGAGLGSVGRAVVEGAERRAERQGVAEAGGRREGV